MIGMNREGHLIWAVGGVKMDVWVRSVALDRGVLWTLGLEIVWSLTSQKEGRASSQTWFKKKKERETSGRSFSGSPLEGSLNTLWIHVLYQIQFTWNLGRISFQVGITMVDLWRGGKVADGFDEGPALCVLQCGTYLTLVSWPHHSPSCYVLDILRMESMLSSFLFLKDEHSFWHTAHKTFVLNMCAIQLWASPAPIHTTTLN